MGVFVGNARWKDATNVLPSSNVRPATLDIIWFQLVVQPALQYMKTAQIARLILWIQIF